jgi:GH15 family glucan-1,4-alpha-glucosidase
VQALALTGPTDEARELMDALLDLAPLGLFPEDIDPTTGRFLGNFAQALTHASLLQAVLALRDAGIHA